MAPVKRTGTVGGRGSQGTKCSVGRVSKSFHSSKPAARKLMRKLRWYDVEESSDVEETSDFEDGFSDNGDIPDGMDLCCSVASQQSPLKQEPVVKKPKSQEEDVNLYDIPQWPGPTSLEGQVKGTKANSVVSQKSLLKGELVVKKHKSQEEGVNLYNIPQWPGPTPLEGEVRGTKAKQYRETRLEDIPQYPHSFNNSSNPTDTPTATSGISPVFSGPAHGLYDYPELGDLDQPRPLIQFHDYNPYYYDLLVEKRRLLLEMERVMEVQSRLDAINATIRLSQARLNAATADVQDESYRPFWYF